MMKWLYSCLQRYMNAWLLKAFVINIMMIIIMTVIRGCVMAFSVSIRCSYPCWNRTTETPNGKRMHISEIDISVHINNSQREFNNNTAAANGQARQLALSETVVVATYTHTHTAHISLVICGKTHWMLAITTVDRHTAHAVTLLNSTINGMIFTVPLPV